MNCFSRKTFQLNARFPFRSQSDYGRIHVSTMTHSSILSCSWSRYSIRSVHVMRSTLGFGIHHRFVERCHDYDSSFSVSCKRKCLFKSQIFTHVCNLPVNLHSIHRSNRNSICHDDAMFYPKHRLSPFPMFDSTQVLVFSKVSVRLVWNNVLWRRLETYGPPAKVWDSKHEYNQFLKQNDS